MADAKEEVKPEAKATELEARIAALETENKALLKEAMEKKDHIRTLEATKQAEEEKHLKEQNKYKELYDNAAPKLERLSKLEPVLNTMLEIEVAEIPEEKRDLLPKFPTVEENLAWIRNAKSKGLFSVPENKTTEKKTPASSVQSKANSNETSQEFLSLSPGDPRLQKLSLKDYQLWKQHNQKSGHGVKGWGGISGQ